MFGDQFGGGGQRQPARAGQRRGRRPVGAAGDHQPGSRGGRGGAQQVGRPAAAPLTDPGQEHAGAEPVQVAWQPVPGAARTVRVTQQQHAPDQGTRGDRGEHQRRPPSPAVVRSAPTHDRQPQQRQREVERHLGAEAPGVPETGQQRPADHRRGECGGGQPDVAGSPARRRHQQPQPRQRRQIAGNQPDRPPPQVGPHAHRAAASGGGEHPGSHQQEPRQHEEHGHPGVPSGQPGSPRIAQRRSTVEADVREQHQSGGHGPQALEHGEVVRRRRVRWRAGRRSAPTFAERRTRGTKGCHDAVRRGHVERLLCRGDRGHRVADLAISEKVLDQRLPIGRVLHVTM